jgi:cation-transporting ATPase 13A2
LPREFHLELLLLLIANVFISWSFEEYGSIKVAKFVGDMGKKWRRFRGRRRDDMKVYKAISMDMNSR